MLRLTAAGLQFIAAVRFTAALAAGFLLASVAVSQTAPATADLDPVKILVGRLDLGRYKATIEGLTRFGDRRQGTDRNRAAVDWIEVQLKSYGCTNTERLKYTYSSSDSPRPSGPPIAHTADAASGGARFRGIKAPIGVNVDPTRQPDEKLRALNSQPAKDGEREEVYCTKIGTTHPEEMYIVGAHMDGHGWGEAANDDGSGTALVMELARVLSAPDVKSERSIRFILWNNEETGLNGAYAYVTQRAALQGKEVPAGSGRYPEPKWLGMIQHDMMLFDHGMPHADGSISREQRPEADVNIEFQSLAKQADAAQKLAWTFYAANEAYATDYPAAVGPHMTNTLHGPGARHQPARERTGARNRRGLGSALASAHRSVCDILRHRLSTRAECRADHSRCRRPIERDHPCPLMHPVSPPGGAS